MEREIHEDDRLRDVQRILEAIRAKQRHADRRAVLTTLIILALGAPSWFAVSGEFRLLRREIMENRRATIRVSRQVAENVETARLVRQELNLQAQRFEVLQASLKAVERRLLERGIDGSEARQRHAAGRAGR